MTKMIREQFSHFRQELVHYEICSDRLTLTSIVHMEIKKKKDFELGISIRQIKRIGNHKEQ